MTVLTSHSTANSIVLHQKYVARNDRRCTDKYWSGLFAVIFVIWIASWQYLSYRGQDYKINSHNDITISISPELVNNVTSRGIDTDNSTNTNTTSEFISNYWGKCWVFDALTFNVGFLDAHYKRSGPIVIWTNILLCVSSIVYAISSMRRDRVYFKQIFYFRRPLFAFLFYYRFLMFLPNRLHVMSLIPFDKKIALWLMPELILIMIWMTKESPQKGDITLDYDFDDDRDGRNDNDKKITFNKFIGYVMMIGIALFSCIEILILVTTTRVYELAWDDPLFYAIAGGSLYVGLTFFYFGLMVISCATSISIDSPTSSLEDLLHAFLIVGRYHFGTACYHATLVFPRLHAAIVSNESEFKEMEDSSTASRFYVTQCKTHNLSPVLTALRGHNHCESTRELLRLFIDDSPKVQYFQGFSRICNNVLVLVVAANSLMLIMFWTHGAALEPRFLMGTWVMYLAVMFLNYVFMRAHDAAADAIWFHVEKRKEVKF